MGSHGFVVEHWPRVGWIMTPPYCVWTLWRSLVMLGRAPNQNYSRFTRETSP